VDSFGGTLQNIGGVIVESRHATLEEVFVYKIGREDLRDHTQITEGSE
jgi:hypothetical protein